MAVFLSVLKIIGITLLVILGILLVVLLLVLFVPIRYAVDAKIDETDFINESDKLKENLYAKASFHWLLYIIRGSIEYPEDLCFKVKVLFFKVYPSAKKSDDISVTDDDIKEDEIITEKEDLGDLDKSDEQEESNDDLNEDIKSEEDTSKENDSEKSESKDIDIDSSDNGEFDDDLSDKDLSLFEIIGKIFETIGNIIKIPQDVFKKIQCTISSICAKIDMIKNTLTNDIFKRAFEVTKKQVTRVLRMILPKKCKINLLLGMEDVAKTADIFSAYGILYPILAGKVYISPDFERQVIGGTVYIRGSIRLFTIIWAALVLYFNKDVKKTIRRFRKIIGS